MESNWLTNNGKTIWRVILITLAIVVLYSVRHSLLSTLTPFLYAAVFAFLINPLINALERRGIKRLWSALFTVLFLFLMLLACFALFIPSIIRDASRLISTLAGGVQNLRLVFDDLIRVLKELLGDSLDIDNRLNELVARGVQLLSGLLSRLLSSLGSLVDVLLIPVITFYFLKDKDLLLRSAGGFFPAHRREAMRRLGGQINHLLSRYVKGKLIVTTLVGVMTGLGCLLLGLPSALTIGVLAGLFDLIPYFGPWLGGILPVMIALMSATPIKALWVVLMILVIQQVESNLITPRVISQSVGMHPLLVMFSVLFFGATMGIPGMILGVPIMSVLLAVIRFIHRSDMLGQQPPPAEPPAPAPQPDQTTEE